MEKEDIMWNESALIDALDNAMSKYKIMHTKETNRNSSGGHVISSTEENVSADVNESDEALRRGEVGQNSNVALPEMDVVKNLPAAEENNFVDSCAPQYNIDSSGVPVEDAQDAQKWYSGSQGAEEYNQLLGQYYELEEKRQKILEHLNQFGSWNYLYSGDGSIVYNQEVACPTSQEDPVTETVASCPDVVCSHCPHVCPCLMAPCTSRHACSSNGNCVSKACNDAVGAAMPLSPVDDDIIKTVTEAARRAISSMQTKSSTKLDSNGEKVEKQETGEGMPSTYSSETDLAVVLNAWYSAGFYTCKFLMEQSLARKKQ